MWNESDDRAKAVLEELAAERAMTKGMAVPDLNGKKYKAEVGARVFDAINFSRGGTVRGFEVTRAYGGFSLCAVIDWDDVGIGAGWRACDLVHEANHAD